MANHGWVSARSHMRPEQLTGMLTELNTTLFRNNLQIDYCPSGNRAADAWVLKYVSGGTEWASRVCWLKTRRRFEMRHGGGGTFAWWVDTAILNEVAVRFNGTIGDDGISDKWRGVPGKFNKCSDFVLGQMAHVSPAAVIAYHQHVLQHEVPEEFRQAVREALGAAATGDQGDA